MDNTEKGGVSNQTNQTRAPRIRSESQTNVPPIDQSIPVAITLLFLPTSEEVSTFKFIRAINRTKSRDPPAYTIHPANNKIKEAAIATCYWTLNISNRFIHRRNKPIDPTNPSTHIITNKRELYKYKPSHEILSSRHPLRKYTNIQTQSWSRSKTTDEKNNHNQIRNSRCTSIRQRCWTCLTYNT